MEFKKLLKFKIKSKIEYGLNFIFNTHNNELNDIFIFSTPRSGSTWLMEILYSQPNIKYVNEPLWVNRHLFDDTNLEPTWYQIFSDQNREKYFKELFDNIINEKLFIGQQNIRDIKNRKFSISTNRRVFKILRAKDLINWFKFNYDAEIIFLLRHPIPTALSWKKNRFNHRINEFLLNEDYKNKFLNDNKLPYIKNKLKYASEFELFILEWCLENLPSLKFLDTSEWFIVFYEDLILNPNIIIDSLYKRLNLSNIELMYKQINTPSKSTSLSDSKTKNNISNNNDSSMYLIKKWGNQVDNEKIRKAYDILDFFNIDVYEQNKLIPNRKSDFYKNNIKYKVGENNENLF